ncbi:MAG: hypothetical protein ACUVS6_07835 [Anaerolineae bacterium]
MPKGRSGIVFLIVLIALLLIAVLLLRQRGLLNGRAQQQAQIPIELRNIIPPTWQLLERQPQPCNLDDDEDNEWLVLYRYDATQTPNVYAARQSSVGHSPIGGVVYDAQVNRMPQELGNLSPYRPALLVPYKLLPDYYFGKGQGYLGETNVVFYRYAPSAQKETRATGQCRAEEFYFLGYSYTPLPTRLSIFRWQGRQVGYLGVHFVGNAHVDAPNATDPARPITEVTTYNRLENHRSLLCEVRRFRRSSDLATLDFAEDLAQFTIDFCFGRPADPAYPEAALIALLRGGNPPAEGSPTGNSFLTQDVSLDPRLQSLRLAERSPLRIVSVINPGSVEPVSGRGTRCPANRLQSPGSATWWCDAGDTLVRAAVVFNGDTEPRWVTARLIGIANEQVTADVHWRVTALSVE